MKLISLNIFGGRFFESLTDFIKQHSKDTDIFCLQEVFQSEKKFSKNPGYEPQLFERLSKLLNNYKGYFAPSSKHHDLKEKVGFEIYFGLATFIRNSLDIESVTNLMIFNKRFADIGRDKKDLPKNIQIIKLKALNKTYTIFNMHGLWYPGNKLDSNERIYQSEKIRKLLEQENGGKILCGDFNLNPETESLHILEQDMKNLIKDFNIKTTRVKKFLKYESIQPFADYILVSPEIQVEKFSVPKVEVSDHLPMILEFS